MNNPSDRFNNSCDSSCLDVFEHLVDGGAQIYSSRRALQTDALGSDTVNRKKQKQRRKTYVYV